MGRDGRAFADRETGRALTATAAGRYRRAVAGGAVVRWRSADTESPLGGGAQRHRHQVCSARPHANRCRSGDPRTPEELYSESYTIQARFRARSCAPKPPTRQAVSGAYQAADGQPTPVMALAVAGMNDVFNSQGFTLAAWRNRLSGPGLGNSCSLLRSAPTSWSDSAPTAVLGLRCGSFLSLRRIAFLLIAEIDSPRSGLIRM